MKILSHKLEELPNLKYNTLITVECDFCHKHFQKLRKIIGINLKRGSKHFFCNQRCKHDFYSDSVIKPEYKCLECGEKVTRSQSQIVKSGNIFCSHPCAATYSNKIRYKNHVYKHKPEKARVTKLNLVQDNKTKEIKLTSLGLFSIKCICKCEKCGIEILRKKNDLLKNKNGLVFCSRSCRMTHQNLNNTKKYSCRKSKAETFLCELIRKDFPNLILSENDRKVLPSKFEIDIYIKELKIAIELNGPFHYFPIFGDETLKKSQNRDIIKKKEIQELGIGFIVIDISRLNSKKKTQEFLIEYYNAHIKPILNGCECR